MSVKIQILDIDPHISKIQILEVDPHGELQATDPMQVESWFEFDGPTRIRILTRARIRKLGNDPTLDPVPAERAKTDPTSIDSSNLNQ
jgi:hypothetical protein